MALSSGDEGWAPGGHSGRGGSEFQIVVRVGKTLLLAVVGGGAVFAKEMLVAERV